MTPQMAFTTQPNNLQRLVIIFVVFLCVRIAAVSAGLLLQFSAPLVCIGIGAAVHLLPRLRTKAMCSTILAHFFSMARIAITASWNGDTTLGTPHCSQLFHE